MSALRLWSFEDLADPTDRHDAIAELRRFGDELWPSLMGDEPLPSCWARHGWVREMVIALMEWRDAAKAGEDGVAWHEALQRLHTSQVFRNLNGCKAHIPPPNTTPPSLAEQLAPLAAAKSITPSRLPTPIPDDTGPPLPPGFQD